jgi:hypothetical protein
MVSTLKLLSHSGMALGTLVALHFGQMSYF